MPGFEFTPGGIRELRDEPVVPGARSDAMAPAAISSAVVEAQAAEIVRASPVASPQPPPSPPPRSLAAAAPLAPKDVLRLARARLKELDRECRRLERLKKEREELRRLVAAASGKSAAVIREIKRTAG